LGLVQEVPVEAIVGVFQAGAVDLPGLEHEETSQKLANPRFQKERGVITERKQRRWVPVRTRIHHETQRPCRKSQAKKSSVKSRRRRTDMRPGWKRAVDGEENGTLQLPNNVDISRRQASNYDQNEIFHGQKPNGGHGLKNSFTKIWTHPPP